MSTSPRILTIMGSGETAPTMMKHHRELIARFPGNPKAVVLDQQNLMIDADCIAKWNHVQDSTTMMCVLPMHHVNGIVVTLVTPLMVGASMVLNRKFQQRISLQSLIKKKFPLFQSYQPFWPIS